MTTRSFPSSHSGATKPSTHQFSSKALRVPLGIGDSWMQIYHVHGITSYPTFAHTLCYVLPEQETGNDRIHKVNSSGFSPPTGAVNRSDPSPPRIRKPVSFCSPHADTACSRRQPCPPSAEPSTSRTQGKTEKGPPDVMSIYQENAMDLTSVQYIRYISAKAE